MIDPPQKSVSKLLTIFLIIYAVASLIHFVHNAEFLKDYPGLPETWTRAGVYLVWLGMTCVGCVGFFVFKKVSKVAGLVIIMAYAFFGLDSLAHYIVAPFSAHTHAMNGTILLEVLAAGLVLTEAVRQFITGHLMLRNTPLAP